MNHLIATAAALAVLLLPSCATKITAAQREMLSTVAVAPTEVPVYAYSEPYGGDRQGASSAAMAGASSGTGALGGVIGSLVGQAIVATQDNLFRSSHKGYFAAVRANTPLVAPIVGNRLKSGIKNDRFFGPRLRENSPNRITSKVQSYQLVRNGKDKDGELLLAPQINVEIQLIDCSGKKLAGGIYSGSGSPNPLSVYAGSAVKSEEGYELAAKMAVDSFTTALAQKTSE